MFGNISKLVKYSVLVISSVIFAQAAQAEKTFEFNSSGLNLSRLIGRTLVGVTRESSRTWSLYLERGGKAYFHFSSGKYKEVTWEKVSNNIICFKGLVKDKPYKKVCKYAKPLGRGLDWMTVTVNKSANGTITYEKATAGERRGSSQIVYSFAGKKTVKQTSYIANVTQWAGHVVVGRTLKDRETWEAAFHKNGIVDFVFASGKRYSGRYTTTRKEVCMKFPTRPAINGCRKPTIKNDKILWASSKDGGAISEIVFMSRILQKRPAVTAQVGPKAFLKLPKSETNLLGTIANRAMFVTYDTSKTRLAFWDSRNGKAVAKHTVDFDLVSDQPNSSIIAVLQKDMFIRVIDLRDGRTVTTKSIGPFVLKNPVSIAVNDTASLVSVATGTGQIQVWNIATGRPITTQQVFNKASIVKFRPKSDQLFAIGSHQIRTWLPKYPDLLLNFSAIDLTDKPLSLKLSFSADGNRLAVFYQTDKEERIQLFDAVGSIFSKVAAKPLTQSIWGLDFKPYGKEILISTLTGKHSFLSSSNLALLENTDTTTNKSDVSFDAYYLNNRGDFVTENNKGVYIWTRNKAATLNMKMFHSKLIIQKALRATELENKLAEQRKLEVYKELLKTVDSLFLSGKCKAYIPAALELKPKDRRSGCQAAKENRALVTKFNRAITAMDCSTAEDAANRLGRFKSRVRKCYKDKAYEVDLSAFNTALQSNDCKTVATLAPRLNKLGAADDCRFDVAMHTDSARKMYFAAIKFDAAKDRSRARTLYLQIMDVFPDDALAIDAANRMLKLNDLDAADRQQRVQNDALKAAKAQAAAATKAANAAKAAAEKERKAREREQHRQERIKKRLAEIKEKMAYLNSRYGFKSGYTRVFVNINGHSGKFGYDISGKFEVRPTMPYPTTAKEYCRVTFESAIYPRKNKVYYSDKYYFEPKSGNSEFEVDLMARPSGYVARLYMKNILFKSEDKNGERYNGLVTFGNRNGLRIGWDVPVRKIRSSGALRPPKSHQTEIQIPGNRDLDSFIKDLRSLIQACQAAG